MGKLIEPGMEVEDFTLKDQHNEDVSLGDFRGRNVLLAFHPLAWTQVCSEQMNRLDVRLDLFDKLNTEVLGISVDTVPSKKAWAKEIKVEKLRLLSDFWPHGKVAESLGIFRNSDGISERAYILINEKGEVIFARVYELTEQPDLREIEDLLTDYQSADIDIADEVEKCLTDNMGRLICMEDLEAMGIHDTSGSDAI